MQGLAFVSPVFTAMLGNVPPWAGADLREGASSLEQLPAVLRVTDPDIPKVLVFHDITALWGQQEPHQAVNGHHTVTAPS